MKSYIQLHSTKIHWWLYHLCVIWQLLFDCTIWREITFGYFSFKSFSVEGLYIFVSFLRSSAGDDIWKAILTYDLHSLNVIYIQNYDWLLIELELPLQFWFQVSTYFQTPNLGKSHWPIHFRCFLVWAILLVQLSDPCKRWNIYHIVQCYLCTFDEAKLP